MNKARKQVYRMQAEVIKAAAHPTRLAVLDCLQRGERCVCEIAKEVDSERSNLSRHLAVMARAGLLDSRKDGLMVYYKLRAPCILDFISCVEHCLKENVEESRSVLCGR